MAEVWIIMGYREFSITYSGIISTFHLFILGVQKREKIIPCCVGRLGPIKLTVHFSGGEMDKIGIR